MFDSNMDKVKIVEVGPRDGLQNEKTILDTDTKIEYIKKLVDSGLKYIEATSFVRPSSIAQMYDSTELYSKVHALYGRDSSLNFPCLVPNVQGMKNAIEAHVSEVALFTATSDEFTKKNINCSVDESFIRMRDVKDLALGSNIRIRGYISTAFGCPYEGAQSSSKLISVIERFLDLGVYEISIGDTIGIATPPQVNEYLKDISTIVDFSKIAMHMHDTRGMAIANILVSLEAGVRAFDSASGGLGGCPYAKGASGNVATEDLLYLLNSMGCSTGVDIEKVSEASKYILTKVNKVSPSRVYQTLIK